MSSFKKAVEHVLIYEGGYVDDPIDPGGRTKYGISARTYPDLDIESLSLEDAIQIYYKDFWVRGKIYMVDDQAIATKLMSIDVNAGIYRGTICLQKALRSVHAKVVEDGIMGPETAAAVNSSDPKQLLAAFRAEIGAFYRLLIYKKPELAKYANGWNARAYA